MKEHRVDGLDSNDAPIGSCVANLMRIQQKLTRLMTSVRVRKKGKESRMDKNAHAGLGALLTPENSVLLLIDHQPFQNASVNSHEPTIRGTSGPGWGARRRRSGGCTRPPEAADDVSV